ncbi:hypothetical protein GcM1_071002 [Golovinomyces cichoracearum]|uniref:Uncharacterized protein n=1 Tax=Golovinomyces cichoracearum TaxID=62708 RepID=A0A420JCB8_9PEZI|nr:hypothetical protein GcM1_071002 [Golovinomyces cichoracearum]
MLSFWERIGRKLLKHPETHLPRQQTQGQRCQKLTQQHNPVTSLLQTI